MTLRNDRVGPMQNPPQLGELIRESMDDVGWNVTETAARLGCERGTLSRLLNGKAGVSANMALALEDIGWGNRRTLDADAGELRACASAPGEGRRRTAHGRAARMIGSRASVAGQETVPPAALHPLSGQRQAVRRAAQSGRRVPDAPVVERDSRPRRRLRGGLERRGLREGRDAEFLQRLLRRVRGAASEASRATRQHVAKLDNRSGFIDLFWPKRAARRTEERRARSPQSVRTGRGVF